jgi:hypothetical protein
LTWVAPSFKDSTKVYDEVRNRRLFKRKRAISPRHPPESFRHAKNFPKFNKQPDDQSMKIKSLFIALMMLSAIIYQPSTLHAQGTTAFTYQGQLHDGGTNANGTYTMIFALYDSVTNGNQIGGSITNSPTLANGLFSVNLDFGNVFNGSAYWLDITITNGGTTQELSPRVQVLPTPYALYAASANVAASASRVASGIDITNALITNPTLTNAYISGSTMTNAFITNSTFAGNGAGLINTIHPLIIPVTANYTVSTNDVNGMSSSNIVYSIQSNPFSGSPLVFTFPTPPSQPVQFKLLLEGTNAITLASPNGTTFVVSSGYGLANSNSISMSGYFGKSETWENTNGTTWQMVANSRTLQEEQDIAATYVGVTNQNGIDLTNIPASAIVGLLYKKAVQEATTANLPPYSYNNAAGTITGMGNSSLGPLAVDGVTVSAGDSVLVKNESSAAFNGIYVCTANATDNNFSLTRRSDFNTATNLVTGDTVSVSGGITNANSTWFLTTTGTIVIGTTQLTFALQSGVKTLNGLTGNVTVTNGANTGIFTNGNIIQISSFVPNIQLFTTSGTFTVPTNVSRIMVEMWGAGGGGGSGSYTTNTSGDGNSDGGDADSHFGGGGGAGAYAWNVFTVIPGTNISVTCGTAGSAGQSGTGSSFGTLLSASGGSAGGNATSSYEGNGGSGGQTTTGSLANVEGGDGQSGGQNGNGAGGGVWRGGANGNSGPGGGGSGGQPNILGGPNPGQSGNLGVVIVYY